MAAFTTQLAQAAVDDLNSIPEKMRGQVIAGIQSLAIDPFPTGSGVKKLKGFKPPLYRLRSGDYRVLYRIVGGTIMIMRVINRKELDKVLKHSFR